DNTKPPYREDEIDQRNKDMPWCF
ncbi:hypothetical protein Tco_1180746, partial [Tanacetum coccineum]